MGYTFLMNTFSCLLTSIPTKGFLWLIFLFFLCFLFVHFFRLAVIGIATLRQIAPTKPEEGEEKKAPTQRAQEPIYYIVERKTRRKKASYGEPKEIRFK